MSQSIEASAGFPLSGVSGLPPRMLGIFVALLSWALNAEGSVVINEIHYHPQSGRLAEEFIELHNTGAAPVNLAGWRLTRGVRFDLPPVFLPANGFLVVAAD